MNDIVYRTEGLAHHYGNLRALDQINMSVRRGEILGIVGSNGAGKSTLLKILCRLLSGWQGKVYFDGGPLTRWDRREFATRVAYVPQQTHMVFPYTARQVALMGRFPHQRKSFLDTRRDYEVVEEALKRCDIQPLAEKHFQDLSGGERQLVVLASALAQEPEVLLLDEPTVFLDLKHQLMIYRILNDLHEQQELTLLVVTHDLNLAESFCDRLLLLKKGRLLAEVERNNRSRITLKPELIEETFELQAGLYQGETQARIVLSFGK